MAKIERTLGVNAPNHFIRGKIAEQPRNQFQSVLAGNGRRERGIEMKYPATIAALLFVLVFAGPSAHAQQTPSVNSVENPFLGSVPAEKVIPGTLRLTMRDAIDRGLRTNLGLSLSGEETQVARGNRLQALSRLLPVVEGGLNGSQQELNLKTMVGPNTLPPSIPSIAGPFHVFDARAYVSAPLLNLSALRSERSASHKVTSAGYTYKQARDTVVLAVGNAYYWRGGIPRVQALQEPPDGICEMACDRAMERLTATN